MPIIKYKGEELDIGRIVGGLAWPAGDKAGFVAVVAEELFPREGERRRHYHLLEEIEEQDPDRLLDRTHDLTRHFRLDKGLTVERFVARLDDSGWRLVGWWQKRTRKELPITDAFYSEDGLITEHIHVLKNCVKSEGTLHLFKGCMLKGYMDEVDITKTDEATDSQHPAVAALGYAVVDLKKTEHELEEDDEEEGPYPSEPSGRSPWTGY